MLFRHYISCVIPVAFLGVVALDLAGATWIPAVAFFLGVPILDPLIGKDRSNVSAARVGRLQRWLLSLAPVALVALYLSSIVVAAWYASRTPDLAARVGSIITVGTIGGIGFSAAHELIHKKSTRERLWGRVGLLCVVFMHFEIEHLCSHHRLACTEKDTSTAWLGESVYGYLKRTIPRGMRFSWEFEVRRLAREGKPAWHFRNRNLWYIFLPAFLAAILGATFGAFAVVLYVGQAAIAICVLMIVAYIEHYGLAREVGPDGTPGRMRAAHSWDSYYLLSSAITFMVQRHADHHLLAKRAYPWLQSHDEALELPAGYQAMIMLSLCPPLWRRIMHRRLALHSARDWRGC